MLAGWGPRCRGPLTSRSPHAGALLAHSRTLQFEPAASMVLITWDACSLPFQPGGLLPFSRGTDPALCWRGSFDFPRGTLSSLPLGPGASPWFIESSGPPQRDTDSEKQGSAFHFLLLLLPQYFRTFGQTQPNPQAHPDPEEVSSLVGLSDQHKCALGSGALTDLIASTFLRPLPGNSPPAYVMTSRPSVPQTQGGVGRRCGKRGPQPRHC